MFYEVATLTTSVSHTLLAVPGVEAYLTTSDARGKLVGCWRSEFGPQNRLIVLREFATRADLDSERQRGLLSSNPFGCGQYLLGLSMESHAPFPNLPPVPAGQIGPIYEFRSYILKTAGLPETLEAWSEMLPKRTKLSPLVIAMYALDGAPRFTHIWAYPGWNERMDIRAEALRQSVWPPRSAPHTLTPAMVSEVYLPTEISPLQ
ncbi:NIPSNAP family protein [Bosea sp. BK604]|uniref:NIPSNAP family protein n=1 Tax=Bosea sp. BK604 TaxID=2512180 RepID=UPI0010506444|nr:NIPSNAP family protein [Bosea sp. BK604]TCR65712.1 NIPSNAP protein [Bosea sp. BK604]